MENYIGFEPKGSAAFAESIAQEILKLGNAVNLFDRGIDIVIDATELNGIFVQKDVTGAGIEIARLTDGADVAKRLSAVQFINAADVFRRVELQILR